MDERSHVASRLKALPQAHSAPQCEGDQHVFRFKQKDSASIRDGGACTIPYARIIETQWDTAGSQPRIKRHSGASLLSVQKSGPWPVISALCAIVWLVFVIAEFMKFGPG